jgi:hypothetical protein
MRLPSFLLWGFFACQFVALTRIVWLGILGIGFAPVAATANVLSVGFATAMSVAYLRTDGLLLSSFGRKLMIFISLWVIVMLVTGLMRGWMPREVSYDLCAWLLLLAFMIAGATDRFWKDFLTASPVVLGAGLLVCLLSLGEVAQKSTIALTGERIARDLSAYRLIWVLYLFPVLMVLVHPKSTGGYFVAAAAMTLALGLQILFQKRLETVFICLILGLVGLRLVLAIRSGNIANGEGPIRVLGASCFIAIAAALLSGIFAPGVLGAQSEALLGRYKSLVQERSGSTAPFTAAPSALASGSSVKPVNFVVDAAESRWYERWWIVSQALEDFTFIDWMFGRGFGGAVAFRHSTIDYYMGLPNKVDLLAPYVIQETGKIGRRQLEVGMAMPLIKGGFPAQALFAVTLLYALLRKGGRDWISQGCKLLVGLYALRYLFGGAFILSDTLQFAAFCAVLGRCLRGDETQSNLLFARSHSFLCSPLRS